jgi:hypothetical protein
MLMGTNITDMRRETSTANVLRSRLRSSFPTRTWFQPVTLPRGQGLSLLPFSQAICLERISTVGEPRVRESMAAVADSPQEQEHLQCAKRPRGDVLLSPQAHLSGQLSAQGLGAMACPNGKYATVVALRVLLCCNV